MMSTNSTQLSDHLASDSRTSSDRRRRDPRWRISLPYRAAVVSAKRTAAGLTGNRLAAALLACRFSALVPPSCRPDRE